MTGRFLRFGIVGGTGAVLNLSLLTLLVEIAGWHYLVAGLVAIEVSTLNNYFLNRLWTWGDRDRSWWSILSYHGVILIGLGLQWTALAVLTGVFGLHYLLAAALGIGAGTAWNFFVNHRVTFTAYNPETKARHLRIALYAASLLLQVGVAAVLTHDWDTFVFQRATEQFLVDGTTPYDIGVEEPAYVFWGLSTPVEPWWYAYPPLPLVVMAIPYAPVAFGLVSAPWAGRILIKLPFILTTLGLALTAQRFVGTSGGVEAARNAKRLERFLLFNPLFIIVATIWGQFESLLLIFLLLSLLAIRAQRWALGGAFWGLAALVKIFPLYLAPVLGLYLLRKAGPKPAFRYFFSGGLIFTIVCFPFFLVQPGGFLEQVFLMHRDRAPGRFAPFAFLYQTLRWISRQVPESLPTDTSLVQILSAASFALTAMVLLLLATASTRAPLTERNLLAWAGVSIGGGLLVTKLLSEQYSMMPLTFFAVALYHTGGRIWGVNATWMRRFVVFATVFVPLTAFFDHALFLIFLPQDVASFVLGQTVHETVLDLASTFGLTQVQLRAILGTMGGMGLIVPLVALLHLVWPGLRQGFHVAADFLHRHPIDRRPWLPAKFVRVTLGVVLVLLLTPAITMGATAPKREGTPETAALATVDQVFLVHYRSDWFNPVIRPSVPGGTWVDIPFTPWSGYYNTVPHKIRQDDAFFRSAGIDGVIISFNPAFEHLATSAATVAAEAAMPHAWEINLEDVADVAGRIALTPASAAAAEELLNGPFTTGNGPGYDLTLGEDGRRVLFVQGAGRVAPTFTDAERRFVASIVEDRLGSAAFKSLSAASRGPLWTLVPSGPDALAASGPQAELWRQAYEEALRAWWELALSFAGPDSEGIDLVVDEAETVKLPPDFEVRVLSTYDPVGKPGLADEAVKSIITVNAPADDPEAFLASLESSTASDATVLILPWNDFRVGQGLEPTIQNGDVLLQSFIDHLDAAGAPRSPSP